MPGAKSSKKKQPRIKPKIRWDRVLVVITLPILIAACLGAYALYRQPPTDKMPVAEAKEPELLKNQLNILVLGINDRNGGSSNNPEDIFAKSDAIMVACISPSQTALKLLSIPRDTKVFIPGVPGGKGYEKINLAYAYGGPRLAQATVEQFLKIPIHHYIVMDWQEFVKIIDAFGGIDLYVENNMSYQDPYANLDIDLRKGYQRLDGEKAGHYVRFCSDELGDIGRVQRQQRFLKIFLQEAVKLETILKLPSLINTVHRLVDTDMPPLTMVKAANTLKGFKMDAIKAEILPGNFINIDGLNYWETDEGQIKQKIENMFYTPDTHSDNEAQPK